jgi:hypothetical protein
MVRVAGDVFHKKDGFQTLQLDVRAKVLRRIFLRKKAELLKRGRKIEYKSLEAAPIQVARIEPC